MTTEETTTLDQIQIDRIDQYIEKNPEEIKLSDDDPCLKETHVTLTQSDGTRKTQKLEVIKLPLDLVYPNVHNGRFRDIYLEEKMNLQLRNYNGLEEGDDPESWDLDPLDDTESGIIRSMLLERKDPDASRLLIKALSDKGQEKPGIITYDGCIMNANRRYAALYMLSEKNPEQFGFIRVVRLPKTTSKNDLFKIEIAEQMGPDYKLDYSAINEVLKVRDGLLLGMESAEIAEDMGKSVEHVQHLEQMYRVAVDILSDHGTPNQWPLLENKYSFLDDLMKQVLNPKKKSAWGLENYVALKKVCYKLFWDDDFGHIMYRRIPEIAKNDRILESFIESTQTNEETHEEADVKEAFDRAVKLVKSTKDAEKPAKLLISINDDLEILSEILENNPLLKKENCLQLMNKIIQHTKKLQDFRDENSTNS